MCNDDQDFTGTHPHYAWQIEQRTKESLVELNLKSLETVRGQLIKIENLLRIIEEGIYDMNSELESLTDD